MIFSSANPVTIMIVGNKYNDILIGGIGRDILNGGSGIDTFIFKPGDGGATKSDADVIEDFQIGIDKIGLTDINFDQLTFQQSSDGYRHHGWLGSYRITPKH